MGKKLTYLLSFFMFAQFIGAAEICTDAKCTHTIKAAPQKHCHAMKSAEDSSRIIKTKSVNQCNHMGNCFLMGELEKDPVTFIFSKTLKVDPLKYQAFILPAPLQPDFNAHWIVNGRNAKDPPKLIFKDLNILNQVFIL